MTSFENRAAARQVRLPPRHPVVTLSEAVTWMACGRYLGKEFLRWLQRRHSGKLPPQLLVRLEEAGKRLSALMLDGKVIARGYRQEDENAPTSSQALDIPVSFVRDGIYMEPWHDAISSDILLDSHWEIGGVYPRYRFVTLDARQLPSEETASGPEAPTIVTAPTKEHLSRSTPFLRPRPRQLNRKHVETGTATMREISR